MTTKRCIQCVECNAVVCQLNTHVVKLTCYCGRVSMDNRDGSAIHCAIDIDYKVLDYDDYIRENYEN